MGFGDCLIQRRDFSWDPSDPESSSAWFCRLRSRHLSLCPGTDFLGAAKTSAYYAVNPFVGSLLSFLFLKEQLNWIYLLALIVMAFGSALVVADTLIMHHIHEHSHTFTHTHDGYTHTHTIVHSHDHVHYTTDRKHGHHHTLKELEALPGAAHV